MCNLRFDDTNPTKEEEEFVEAIKDDIRLARLQLGPTCTTPPSYYDQIYEFALDLIRRGLAYVDDLSKEEIREYRGTLTEPGKNSPYRDRTPEENLDLFLRMKNGEFPEGSRVLRAKIDMASPNMQPARPHHLPHQVLHASPHGRQVVHLSDVRLRAPDRRRAGGRDPLALLAGV